MIKDSLNSDYPAPFFYACKLYALLVSFDGWEKGQVVVGVCSYWEKIRFVKCHGGQMRRKGHK